jgi:hypothetical protein
MPVVVVPYKKTLSLSQSVYCYCPYQNMSAAVVPYHYMYAVLIPYYHMSAAFHNSLDVGLPDHKNLLLLSLSKNMPAAVFCHKMSLVGIPDRNLNCILLLSFIITCMLLL